MLAAAYHPLLPEESLGEALGYSPEPWQVSESLVRWGRVECQALDRLRIRGLFSLHVKDGGGSHALVLSGKSLCRQFAAVSSEHIISAKLM